MQANYTATINVSYYTKVSCQKSSFYNNREISGLPYTFFQKMASIIIWKRTEVSIFQVERKKTYFFIRIFLKLETLSSRTRSTTEKWVQDFRRSRVIKKKEFSCRPVSFPLQTKYYRFVHANMRWDWKCVKGSENTSWRNFYNAGGLSKL